MINDQKTQDWIKAGEVAGRALEHGKSLIKPGVMHVEVLDAVEKFIVENGAGIAFPAQISVNDIAAHQCANNNEQTQFKEGDVVKLDVGAHVNGCIGDTAATVDLGGNDLLVEASRDALKNALKLAKPGTEVREIGKVIEDSISAKGFKPIRNLSGHGLAEYNVHSKPTIPNFDNGDRTKLEEGQIIAIEPFATDGAGFVYEKGQATVYMQVDKRPVRNPYAREVFKLIEGFGRLPFTLRWLTRKMSEMKVRIGLRELVRMDVVKAYPPLAEKNGGKVSQAEHSLIIAPEPRIITLVERRE